MKSRVATNENCEPVTPARATLGQVLFAPTGTETSSVNTKGVDAADDSEDDDDLEIDRGRLRRKASDAKASVKEAPR